jgi:hypothetical protein
LKAIPKAGERKIGSLVLDEPARLFSGHLYEASGAAVAKASIEVMVKKRSRTGAEFWNLIT